MKPTTTALMVVTTASTLAIAYLLDWVFNRIKIDLTDNQFYFIASFFSLAVFYLALALVEPDKGIKHNWRLILLCSLSIIDAVLLASFLMAFFFNGLYDPMLHLYWESKLSWRVIYSSIELLLILELAYNGVIYLYSFIHSNDSGQCELSISDNKKVERT
jgi:hypothetical protein